MFKKLLILTIVFDISIIFIALVLLRNISVAPDIQAEGYSINYLLPTKDYNFDIDYSGNKKLTLTKNLDKVQFEMYFFDENEFNLFIMNWKKGVSKDTNIIEVIPPNTCNFLSINTEKRSEELFVKGLQCKESLVNRTNLVQL